MAKQTNGQKLDLLIEGLSALTVALTATQIVAPATVAVAKPVAKSKKKNSLDKYEANVRRRATTTAENTGKNQVIYQTTNGSGVMKIYYKSEAAFKTVPAEKILHVFEPVVL